MPDAPSDAIPRDERRRRTEAAILDAARALFAEAGFERATIREVAARAGVDPALVMQHYGSKERLFAAAATSGVDHTASVVGASRDRLASAALHDLFQKFEMPGMREATVAMARSCLTHPEAGRIVRDDVMCSVTAGVARTIGGDDAELRAALMAACLVGLSMTRYLFEVPVVAEASREDIERLMEPVLRALVEPPE